MQDMIGSLFHYSSHTFGIVSLGLQQFGSAMTGTSMVNSIILFPPFLSRSEAHMNTAQAMSNKHIGFKGIR